MVKLWARTVKDNKTLLKYDFIKDVNMEWADFFEYVRGYTNERIFLFLLLLVFLLTC